MKVNPNLGHSQTEVNLDDSFTCAMTLQSYDKLEGSNALSQF